MPSSRGVKAAMTLRVWRVLVVDADAEVRDVVEDLLFERGFEVRQAANAAEAVLELRANTFDVLLCHLPVLHSGHDPLRRRIREFQPTLRVVAMSATGARASSDEASVSLSKPFTRSQLLQALRPGL